MAPEEDRMKKAVQSPDIPLAETRDVKGAQGRGAGNRTVLEKEIPVSDRCTLRSI